jgi:hypothetical protein
VKPGSERLVHRRHTISVTPTQHSTTAPYSVSYRGVGAPFTY